MELELEVKKDKIFSNSKIMAFIVLENKSAFNCNKFYDKQFLNFSLKQICTRLVENYRYEYVYLEENELPNLFNNIKSKINLETEIVVVIFADACLLEKRAIEIGINSANMLGAVNLNKSFVCTTNYLKDHNFNNIKNLEISNMAKLNGTICSKPEEEINNIFQQIIFSDLLNNNVKIVSKNNTKIDFSVNIEGGTILSGNIKLLEDSQILKNTTLCNVTIVNSFVGENCKLENVIVKNCIIKNNKSIIGLNDKNNQLINECIVD